MSIKLTDISLEEWNRWVIKPSVTFNIYVSVNGSLPPLMNNNKKSKHKGYRFCPEERIRKRNDYYEK